MEPSVLCTAPTAAVPPKAPGRLHLATICALEGGVAQPARVGRAWWRSGPGVGRGPAHLVNGHLGPHTRLLLQSQEAEGRLDPPEASGVPAPERFGEDPTRDPQGLPRAELQVKSDAAGLPLGFLEKAIAESDPGGRVGPWGQWPCYSPTRGQLPSGGLASPTSQTTAPPLKPPTAC